MGKHLDVWELDECSSGLSSTSYLILLPVISLDLRPPPESPMAVFLSVPASTSLILRVLPQQWEHFVNCHLSVRSLQAHVRLTCMMSGCTWSFLGSMASGGTLWSVQWGLQPSGEHSGPSALVPRSLWSVVTTAYWALAMGQPGFSGRFLVLRDTCVPVLLLWKLKHKQSCHLSKTIQGPEWWSQDL